MNPVRQVGPHPSEVAFISSAPRPTPTPPNVKFAEVLARNAGALARSAEATMRSLPGTAMVALALRGPAGAPGHVSPGMSTRGGAPVAGVAPAGAAGVNAAEGPGGASGAAAGAGMGGEPGIDASLSQAQEMNLYYLRVQEEMNAQNRTYSALSNVLKAQHDTVKNAISNIR